MAEMPEHVCKDLTCCHCQKTMFLHEGRRPVTVRGAKHWVCRDCFDDYYAEQKLPWIKYP